MDLDSVADELYAAAPEDFTALRTQRVSDAKKTGDRALAKEVGALRRPTRSGWLVNLLARRAPEELQSLMDLGTALREAQERLSGPDLRRLSAERHTVVGALARRAAGLASEEGQATSEAVRLEVAGTLQAALADPSAAEVVLAGRVVAAITYGGFGTIDLGGAPVVTRRTAPAKTPTHAEPVSPGASPDDAGARAAADREAAIAEAERALATLAEALTATGRTRQAAMTADVEAEAADADARQHVDDLRSALQQAKETCAAAETRRTAVRAALEHADEERDRAQHDRDEAADLLLRLRES